MMQKIYYKISKIGKFFFAKIGGNSIILTTITKIRFFITFGRFYLSREGYIPPIANPEYVQSCGREPQF